MNNRYRSKCRTVKGPKFNNIEIWNLRDILSRHIYKGLVQFKKAKRCGYPGTVTINEWENILDKMIWTFREIKDDFPNLPYNIEYDKWRKEKEKKDEPRFSSYKTKNGMTAVKIHFNYTDELKDRDQEYRNRIDEGKKLFVKYIEDLWD